MAAVYVNNLVINVGSNFNQTFTLEGVNNSALDLTNYTVSSKMRKWSGSSTYVEFTTSVPNPPTDGKIILSLTSNVTGSIKPGRYIYDIVISDQSGFKTRVVEGMVLVREGATY